ncbi:sulfatase [Halorubrum kocurii]|uniref:Sulfatase n=1 Tax=Halorubrum kocurii JCM 14978 TaxID=1230456 RepID=M0NM50_9EURY|nr:sulfatase [Halorubrum kocurii]EMA57755.1 sulfatase [Halorubrum kocurii JCM 14978]
MSNPDILFVILDSVRRDRVSAYGHERKTTPTLDRLAEEATLFESAYTAAPWTLPSHCSMFTGLLPSEHGITNGFSDRSLRLPESIETLTERLSADGYRTAGFSNNPWVGSLSKIDRGFDEYVEWDLEIGVDGDTDISTMRDRLYSAAHGLLAQAARQPVFLLKRPLFTSNLVNRASRWLRATARDEPPAFTFLNLMEAHSPYFPPKDAFQDLDLSPPGPIEPRLLNTKLLAYVLGRSDLPPERRERVLEFYDASLRYQDRKLDQLLSVLKETGRYDDALVVITSDHGKNLGDLDRDGTPPHSTREVNTDVPLIVKRPEQDSPERVSDPASLTGIFDLVTDPELPPREALCSEEGTLVEDYVPHTGRTSEPTTQWRILTDSEHRYVRAEDGRDYLFGPDGEPLSGDREPLRNRFSEAMESRVEKLSERGNEAKSDPEKLSRGIESQLEDLGYLE